MSLSRINQPLLKVFDLRMDVTFQRLPTPMIRNYQKLTNSQFLSLVGKFFSLELKIVSLRNTMQQISRIKFLIRHYHLVKGTIWH